MYFTKLRVDGFKSLCDFEINLNKGINIIFGNNGTGKSTIIEVFEFLNLTVDKLGIEYKLKKDDPINATNLYESCKTKGIEKDIDIFIEFYFEGKRGEYHLIMGSNDTIVKEKLSYQIEKKIMTVIDKTSRKNSSGLDQFFKNFNMLYDINGYSLITLLKDKINNKALNIDNVETRLIGNFFTDLNYFLHSRNTTIQKRTPMQLFNFMDEKSVNDKKNIIDKFEEFLISIDDTILGIEYKLETYGDQEKFVLYFNKQVNNNEVQIRFSEESKGTKQYLRLFNEYSALMGGRTIVIDELDDGLHNNLVKKIVKSFSEVIGVDNQALITTHDLELLNLKYIANENKFIVENNIFTGQRSIKNLSGEDKRNDIAKRYKNGYFSNVPDSSSI